MDYNLNGTKDAAEPYVSNVMVKSEKAGYIRSAITYNGSFKLDVDTGTYKTTATYPYSYYNIVPAITTTTFTSYFATDSVSFGIQPIAGKHDLSISSLPLSASRPGFTTQYKLMYKNQGTDTITSGTVQFVKSSKLTYVSSSPAYTSINGDTLRWNYSNLKPQDTASINIKFSVVSPPSANIGDKITSIASISPVTSDLTPSDDTSRLVQILVGSIDPNDKSEIHAGSLTQQQLSNNEWLQYTIRFQNTGTDTAFNVYIRDTLSSKVDWSTLQMVSSSHNYQLTINDNNKLSWAFNTINLVDSNRNEPASHGYIIYRVKPAPSLVAGDTVKNTASIYFDYNLPVATNRENTIVQSIILPVKLISFTANRDGAINKLDWNFNVQETINHFDIERSNDGIHYVSVGKVNAAGNGMYSYADHQPVKAINYYRIKMVDKDGSFEYSAVRTVNNTGSFEVNIYPNPVRNILSLKVYSEKKTNLRVQITDVDGKIVQTQQLTAETGSILKTINASSLKSGNYFLKITSATKEQWVIKFEKL